MRNGYLFTAALSCSAVAVTACAQATDPGEIRPAIESTATSAISAPAVTVIAGLGHSCEASSRDIRCWGSNSNGQLGNGTTVAQRFQPAAVTGITLGTTAVSAGSEHMCAVVNGAAMCWGANRFGQLGNGTDDATVLPDNNAPSAVTGLSSGVQAIAAGDSHSCAIVNGAALCWGTNAFGELGDGSIQLHRSPVAVHNPAGTVQRITAGGEYSCEVINGAAMCWGHNDQGQLGNATAANPHPGDSNTPVQVTGLTSGVQAITAGLTHACALVNGGVMCWGNNDSGQLGNGTNGVNAGSGAPVQVAGLMTGVVAIAAGQQHTCAILASGAAQCWGSNSQGQLGNGSTNPNDSVPPDSNKPVQVTGLTSGVLTIATGYQHSCAATAGHVWCWGANGNAQIATDPDLASLLPAPSQVNGLILGGCADGSDEQVFSSGMVGCAGTATFASRAALCAPGYQPAAMLQWTSYRGAVVPTHNYWTNDALMYNGTGPSACFVSLSVGTLDSATPMHVCTANGADLEGNHCDWTQCGLYSNMPNQYFGGRTGSTAGTVCVPIGTPASSCTHPLSCPKWENGVSGSTSVVTTNIASNSRQCSQFCIDANQCNRVVCDPTVDFETPTTACQSAANAQLLTLRANAQTAIKAEANFNSVADADHMVANANTTASVTPDYKDLILNPSESCAHIVGDPNPLFPGGGGGGGGGDGGGGGCTTFWTEQIVCDLDVTTPVPINAPNEACGCAQ